MRDLNAKIRFKHNEVLEEAEECYCPKVKQREKKLCQNTKNLMNKRRNIFKNMAKNVEH